MSRVCLQVCCNDYRNGLPLGRVSAVHVCEAEFACRYGDWAPRLTVKDEHVRFGGLKLRCLGYQTWVGNWCWDAVTVSVEDAERLLNWPKFRKWFDLEGGPETVWKRWECGADLRFKRPTPTEREEAR